MKIEYARNLMASYMIIEQENELAEWEAEMISHCSSKGILFATNQREDEHNMLWYNITGRQALDLCLEFRELDHVMLCRILMQLYEAAETLEGHLLIPGNLLLHPECIFTDHDMNRMCFCYYPGKKEEMSQAFVSFIEYLLTKLDHKDERAVETAYALHEKAVKEGAGLLQLGELLRLPYGKESGYGEEILETHLSDENKKDGMTDREETQVISKQVGNAGILQKLNRCLINFWKNWNLSGIKRKKEWTQDPFLFEPEDEPEKKTANPTVLLTHLSGYPLGILRYEGNNECHNLEIKNTPYVIGSDENCDGYIPSSTVSRRHARITKEDDIYFIEDLNSSNGTYVGGDGLKYKVKMSMEKNEIIIFADEKFRFI